MESTTVMPVVLTKEAFEGRGPRCSSTSAETIEWWQPLKGPVLIQACASPEVSPWELSQQIAGSSTAPRATTLVVADPSRSLQTWKTLARCPWDRVMWVGEEKGCQGQEERALAGSKMTWECRNSLEEAIEALRQQCRPHDVVVFRRAPHQPFEEVIRLWNQGPVYSRYLIHLSAIRHNVRVLRRLLPHGTRIMAMVKARAYGTEDVHLVRFLARQNIDIFGLAYADEAVALRQEGITQDLFVLAATPGEAAKVVQWRLQVGVSDEAFLLALEREAARQGVKAKVHLHVDTGMRRFGCKMEDALPLARRVHRSPHLLLEGLMTHFPSADDPASDGLTQGQCEWLKKVLARCRSEGIHFPWVHCANSAGALDFSFPEGNMVRVGLALYGLDPSSPKRRDHGLQNALSLVSQIVGLNECDEGQPVSYGGRYRASRPRERLGVVPLGYFDGIHRLYSNKGYVLVRGREAPIVGSVCMDCCMVNVTDIPDVKIGDSVVVFGQAENALVTADRFAESGGTIAHELITCLGPRVARVFLLEKEVLDAKNPVDILSSLRSIG